MERKVTTPDRSVTWVPRSHRSASVATAWASPYRSLPPGEPPRPGLAWAKPEYTPRASHCHRSTTAFGSGVQPAAFSTRKASSSGTPGRRSRTLLRTAAASNHVDPAMVSGVRLHVPAWSSRPIALGSGAVVDGVDGADVVVLGAAVPEFPADGRGPPVQAARTPESVSKPPDRSSARRSIGSPTAGTVERRAGGRCGDATCRRRGGNGAGRTADGRQFVSRRYGG